MSKNSYALVTGASGGIGLELARILANNGYNLILIARSEEKLYEIANELKQKNDIDIIVITNDLSKESASLAIYRQIESEQIDVEILINNAGFGGRRKFAETDLDYELGMMQVNMVVPVELTKYFLPNMLKRGRGKIMNVASTAAFAPGPLMSIYYATKAFILSFSEAIASEVKGTGVTVTALCPGPTKTGFQKQAGIENSNLFSSNIMDSKSVAEIGFKAMMKGKPVAITGLLNKFLIFATRFSPRKLNTAVIRWIQKKRK